MENCPENRCRSRYEGPTGITGVLNTVFSDRGIRTTGLWAGVPHYVPDPPCPGATQELLGALGTLWGVLWMGAQGYVSKCDDPRMLVKARG